MITFFQLIFSAAGPAMDWIDGTIGGLGMPSQSSNGPNMDECTNLNWGFFNYDSTSSRTICLCLRSCSAGIQSSLDS